MTNREEGILALALASDGKACAATESHTDVSQSELRAPHRHGLRPCILPDSRQWRAYRQRMILGYESLLIQGLPRSLLHDLTEKFNPSNKFLQALAGHAYNAGVACFCSMWLTFGNCSLLALKSIQYTHHCPNRRGDAPTEATLLLQFPGSGLAQARVCVRWGC